MRILHTESSTGWGGQEIRILTEARGFIDRGHHVTILCPETADLYPAALKADIPAAPVPIHKKRLPDFLALRRWLVRHGQEFDVINSHSSTDSWLTALCRTTLPGLPPLVRTRHVSTAVNNALTTRWLYQRATAHIVTTGEALRQQLHRDNGYALDTMTSVPTGIDLGRFRPLDRETCRATLGLDPAKPLLGIVATLRDWKGHSYLFEALARLAPQFPDWRLVVVGDGPYEPSLQRRLTELALGDRVSFVGRQSNIPEWLSAFDLFVLPSYGDEGVPQSILQAMACGLPVVSTPIGSIAEAVHHGETGLLVPPKDSAALATALAALMSDPAKRQTFGTAGLALAQEKFGLAPMLDRMEAVFRRATGL